MRVILWCTLNCNLNCKYCYENNKVFEKMEYSIIDNIIKYIINNKNNSEINIQFHGGEPLLELDFIKQAVKIFNEKLYNRFNLIPSYSMTTNGTLVTDESAKYLFENNFNISASLDGTEKSHNINRIYLDGSGSFENSYKGAMILKKYFKNLRIRVTINKSTLQYIYENIIYLYDSGFTTIDIALDLFENWNSDEMIIYESILKKLSSIFIYKEHNIGIFKRAERKTKNANCDGGISSVHITPNGCIYPCTYTVNNPKYIIGDIYSGIDENKLSNLHNLSKMKNENCVGCARYDYCSATRCKIINEIMTNDPNLPKAVICILENISLKVNKYYNKLENDINISI